MATAKVGWEPGKGERFATRLGPDVGRDRKHLGNAQTDRCLFGRAEHLTQGGVGERLGLLAPGGGVQPDGGSRDERAAQGMIRWGELKRPAAQVGGGPWVGRTQRLSGLEQRRDGGLVPGLSARHQLKSDLHGQRASGEEDRGRLTIERTADRDGDAGPHGLQRQVVDEGQRTVPFDQHVAQRQLLQGL